jgi:hypothetical protein
MKFRLGASTAIALVLMGPLPACAQGASGLFAKPTWQVAAVSCPLGCSDFTRNVLQKLKGQALTLSATTFEAPFVERCEGTLRVDVHQRPVADVLAELVRAAPPGTTKPVPADLGWAPGATVTSAWVFCRQAGREGAYQRVLSIEPGRVQLLFEEQSVIELR